MAHERLVGHRASHDHSGPIRYPYPSYGTVQLEFRQNILPQHCRSLSHQAA